MRVGMHMVLRDVTPTILQTLCVKGTGWKKIHRFYLTISTDFYFGLELTNLDESDGLRLLAETLTTEIEAVFTDKTSLVSAKAAVNECIQSASEILLERLEMLTTDGYPFRTFLDEKTKQRRVSFGRLSGLKFP